MLLKRKIKRIYIYIYKRRKEKKNFKVFMFSQVLLLGLPLVAGWMVRSLEQN